MKIKFKTDDDLSFGEMINMSSSSTYKYTMNIIHRFHYTTVFMNMKSMKKMLILQICKVYFLSLHT